MTAVHRPGADETYSADVNNAGQGPGSSFADGILSSFIWSAGAFTALAGPAGSAGGSAAFGISDGGTVVGDYFTAPDAYAQGYLYTAGSYQSFSIAGAAATSLRGISPDGRWLSGYYGDDAHISSFVFDRTSSVLTTLAGNVLTKGVDNGGRVAGNVNGGLPFLYSAASGTRIDYALPGYRFRDVTDSGFVVGFRSSSAGLVPVYGSAAGFMDLALGAGLSSGRAFGTNDAGWIVGDAVDEFDMPTAFIAMPAVAAVPEPEVVALIGAGLVLLGARTRRRSHPAFSRRIA